MRNGNHCDFSESKTDRLLFLSVAGHADYLHCQPLKKFLDWNAHPGANARVVLEFSRCKSVDSTVLGLIAQAAIRMTTGGKPSLVLANLRGAPLRSATQLGLTHLALLTDEPELAGETPPAIPLPAEPLDRSTIRAAHEALVEANPDNRDLFADFLSFSTPAQQN